MTIAGATAFYFVADLKQFGSDAVISVSPIETTGSQVAGEMTSSPFRAEKIVNRVTVEVIEKAVPGPQGPPGAAGPAGEKGEKGDKGEPGAAGTVAGSNTGSSQTNYQPIYIVGNSSTRDGSGSTGSFRYFSAQEGRLDDKLYVGPASGSSTLITSSSISVGSLS